MAHDGWTLDTLHSLMDERDRRYTERSAQQDLAVNAALAAADKAVTKAEVNAEKWRDNANEWRQAMDDRERRFLGKDEAALMVGAAEARIALLENTNNQTIGRTSGISQGADERVQASIQRTNTIMAFLFALSLIVGIAGFLVAAHL